MSLQALETGLRKWHTIMAAAAVVHSFATDRPGLHNTLYSCHHYAVHPVKAKAFEDLNIIAMIGTSYQPCWLAEA